MLTIFLGVSSLVIVAIAVQKWVRLKKSSLWPSDAEFRQASLEDAKLSPVVDYVCGHLYNDRVQKVCRRVFLGASSSAGRTHSFVLARTKKAQRSFDDLLKGKHNLKDKGPASFFLKRISEHKKSTKDSG